MVYDRVIWYRRVEGRTDKSMEQICLFYSVIAQLNISVALDVVMGFQYTTRRVISYLPLA